MFYEAIQDPAPLGAGAAAGGACAALLGVWLDGAQAALSDQVIRLHVLANSDSEADQALKLRVRDRILAEAEELFVPGAGRAETEELLRAHLYDLAAAGAEVVGEAGYSYPVTASLVHDYWFPTKTYTDFALPAGAYTALRIEIGAGAGRTGGAWCSRPYAWAPSARPRRRPP